MAGTQVQSRRSSSRKSRSRFQPDFSELIQNTSSHSNLSWQQRRDLLLQQEIAFIHNADFETLDWQDICGDGQASIYSEKQSRPKSARVTVDLPPYLGSLYAVPLLTAEGEQLLFRKLNYVKYWANVLRSRLDDSHVDRQMVTTIEALLNTADCVRNQIVQSNLRLVVSIARKFSNSRQEFDEMVSEGNMILLNAVEKFDYSRGFRFSTYTTHAVQRHFYRRWQTQQRRRRKIQSAPQEIMDEVPMVRDDTQYDPEPIRQLEQLIDRFDECLDDRERRIVEERFGLGQTSSGRTLRQIAEDLGISKERVRQLQFKAIDKLRQLAMELGVSCTPA